MRPAANAARLLRQETPTGRRSARTTDDEFTRSARLTWAKLIRRVNEVDPLLRPFCGAGLQREALAALTFFHRSVETDRATVLAIERVVSFLNELKEKPALRFHLREPPGN